MSTFRDNRDNLFNNMKWIFTLTPIKHGTNKSSWKPPACSCAAPPRQKTLTPHPGSARSRLPGQGHGRLRVLGEPSCRRWRTPWTTAKSRGPSQAPPRTSAEKWACRGQHRTCLRPEREDELARRRASFSTKGKTGGRTLHTVQGVCVCVGGVNTETVCKLSIRISESFIPEAVCVYPVMLLRMKWTHPATLFFFFSKLYFMHVVSWGNVNECASAL